MRADGVHTHVDTASEETHDKEGGIEHTAGYVDELDVLRTSGSETTNGTEHADGAKGHKADDEDLSPWRVVCDEFGQQATFLAVRKPCMIGRQERPTAQAPGLQGGEFNGHD